MSAFAQGIAEKESDVSRLLEIRRVLNPSISLNI